MLDANVVEGVHRITDSYTNWYLLEEQGRLTVVDAGVPASWQSLHDALARLGRKPSDIEAVVLTHAHVDHVGFAERARTELDVPLYVHENDAPLARHPWRYDDERPRAIYLPTRVKALPIVATLLRGRPSWPAPVRRWCAPRTAYRRFRDPHAWCSRRATLSHCALHLPERDALIAGDAIVMLDPYTGRRGPRPSPGRRRPTSSATCAPSTRSPTAGRGPS